MAGNHSLDDFLDGGDDAESEAMSGASGSTEPAEPAESVDVADAVDVAEAVDGGNDDQAVATAGPGAGTESAALDAINGTADPAEITYDWSPEGAACDACGEPVERRWRAGEGADDPAAMVCGDCKDW